MSQDSEASNYSREVLDLFHDYVHGAIDRRGFLAQAAVYTGSTAAATSLLTALSPDFARGQVIKPEDPRIVVSWVEIPSPKGNGMIKGYLVRPAKPKAKKLPVIIVAHENRGLNPHIEDIARRLGVSGYIALAPDALTPLGGYPGDEDKARELFTKLDRPKISEDFVAAANYALTMPGSNGTLGTTGFCFGGGIANQLAVRIPQVKAAAPFYGGPPPLELVPQMQAELLANFGGNDTNTNKNWPPYEEALKKAGKTYHVYFYENAEHGFNNDTTPRFNKAAADLAWSRTMDLFKRKLG
ncbi:dienelactone hydrolase family protein [Novosphingobium flavum]|uniref:Dienelactone hydrolase family protein n=1 Tax=Novosphingobium flavum TaxID=1778672 RepID=A0A7X1FSF1_9SPHN|nr:dienelactone hydrolase family protein [Novosphingobium flavum]MBC2666140.1 dienelactone hydrolase family protein [Novosphingobium flavum]